MQNITSNYQREPIAIVGMGCRFPGGANNPEQFWQLLINGVDAITEVPPTRWSQAKFYNPDSAEPGKTYSRWGGFINQIEEFDARFFKISSREAACIDPQHRLLLEVAWEALENAGQVPEQLAGSPTGVFVGLMCHDYGDLQLGMSERDESEAHTVIGSILSMAANRISYSFDFTGPSLTLDTACSSSLVAVHLACQSLWSGECTMALAGGANAMLRPEMTVAISRASLLSEDGRCQSFDAKANGYVRGEGAGMVVLKPLSLAIAAHDPIAAVIATTTTSQDGRKFGIGAPDHQAQVALLRRAYAQAGVDPHQVSYVEAHGTGTFAGDPVEANAIGEVLGRDRPAGQDCLIGSVKSNIGHLEAGAGVAGLIKAALCLQHQQVPPSLHFETPNPKIDFQGLKVRVPTTLEPLPSYGNESITIGVNSFGFGGTNAHAVLQQYVAPTLSPVSEPADVLAVLSLSVRHQSAIAPIAQQYLDFLSHTPASWPEICRMASLHRSHHDHRLAVVAASKAQAIEQFQAFNTDPASSTVVQGQYVRGQAHRLVFVCSGMGPQWWAMGRSLIHNEPVVRETIQTCDRLLKEHVNWSLWAELNATETESRMAQVDVAQPAYFALQVALAKLWEAWGIKPDAIVGHSAGEIAAAHIAGALTLEDAIQVIVARSQLQKQAAGQGTMLAIALSETQAELLLAGYRDRVSIAAINSPQGVTLSGDGATLQEIAEFLTSRDVFCRQLAVDIPFHSAALDPLKGKLIERLNNIQPQIPKIDLFSTVTGQQFENQMDADYWANNLREPVRFSPAIAQLIEQKADVFLEISCHPVLSRSIAENLDAASAQGQVLHCLRRKKDDRQILLTAIAQLYTLGYAINWSALYPEAGQYVRLPNYPWQRKRYWKESEAARRDRLEFEDINHDIDDIELHSDNSSPQITIIQESTEQTISEENTLNSALQVQKLFAQVLGTALTEEDLERSPSDLGLDSLMSLELNALLEKKLALEISTTQLMQNISINQLIEQALSQSSSTDLLSKQTPIITETDSIETDWIVNINTNPDAAIRLFCFPYNSGSIATFYDWPNQLPDNVEVLGIQLPGGADRRHDKPLPDITTVVQTLAPLLKPYLDRPFAFYGHSLGALISFELAHELWQSYQLTPKMLWIGAWSAPHLLNPYPALENKTDEEVIRDILPLIDVPETVRQNIDMMRSLLPLLRNGAKLCENYQYVHSTPLNCPITVFSGSADQVIQGERITAWQQHTTHPLISQIFDGGHLFIHDVQDAVLANLSEKLTSIIG
ncbi:MAG: acyltransferase domain-containing protein [Spirulina sp. SIO3F2]|nr:acyltransferase domain-containing protein [Spirulina sp. SIO3F2]